MKIKKTVIFSRHGIRYPLIYKKQFIDLFGTDITNWDFSDEQMGVLTDKGELLEHKFGIKLKKLLGNIDLDNIFVNSMKRTYLTARSISLGLNPYKIIKINTKIPDFSEMDLDFCLRIDPTNTVKQKGEKIDKNFMPIYTRMEELLKVKKGTISNLKTTFHLDEIGFLHVRGALKVATDICDLFILKYYEGFSENEIFVSDNFIEDMKFMAKAKDEFLDCIFADTDYQNVAIANVYDNVLLKELKSDNKDALIVGHDSNLSVIMSKLGINYKTNKNSLEKYPIGAKLIFKIYEDNSYDLYYTYFDYKSMRDLNSKKDLIVEFLKKGQL